MFEKIDDIKAELERKSQQLQACNLRFRTIMTKSLRGILIVDMSKTVRFANPAAAAIFGCNAEQLTGTQFDYPIEPDKSAELQINARDGRAVIVEIWAVETEWDAYRAYFVSLRDISESRRNEAELRKLSRAVTESPSMVIITDARGNIEYVNPKFATVSGYSFAEAVGRNPRFLKSDKVAPEVYKELWETVIAGREWRGEMINRKKNGELYWEYAAICPIKDIEGVITNFVAVTEDITERKKVEEALRESEERFRATFSQAAVGIGHVALDGRWLRINQKYCDIVGYTEEELKAVTIREITHPDDLETSMKHFQHLLEGKLRNYSLEKRYIRKDGSIVWVNLTASMVSDADGNPRFAVGVVEDITPRRQAEEALRFSEARFRALFRDNPIMIVTLDADLTMLTVNPSCANQLGYSIDELEGQSVLTLFHEDDRPAVTEQLRTCMQNPDQVYRWQFRKVRKDGGLLWVEETAQGVYDLSGALNLLVVCHNITERKRAEDELKKTSRQNELILTSAGEGILGLDMEGNHTFVNSSAAAMLGYDVNELIGKNSHATWHYTKPDGSSYPAEECPIFAAYKDGAVHSGEEMFWRKDCTAFPVEFISRPIISDGETVGAVLTFNDITERKQMAEEIERLNTDLAERAAELEGANRELEAFNYTVAHDLRQPLNVISSYCQVIKELCGDKLDEACNSYLQETYDGTLRMNRLIEALLNFSRLAHGEMRRETVDLSAMAHEVTEESERAEPGRRVTFLIANGISAYGDKALLRVVLDNLLGNAWKYTGIRQEAVIEFGMTEVDGMAAYFVRDNGAGFDMTDADNLFTPFRRLPGSEESRGFGIGLATVERIVRRHGGRVWAEGEAGKGATFYFTLG